MSRRPSKDQIMEALLRLNVIVARRAAALTNLGVSMAETALAVHRFGAVMRLAEQRDVNDVLFEHPDVVEMDMADAYWRPEEA